VAQDVFNREPVDWDAMELEAFNLKYERLSSRERLRKARKLAGTYTEHNKPLPNGLDFLRQDLYPPAGRQVEEELEDSLPPEEPADTAALT
jgi:hypothetical protein